LAVVSSTAAEAAPGGPASHPRDDGGLGSTGELVSGLVGGAGTLGFLLPSPNGSGANFVNGVMAGPGAAITGAPTSILPYGLLDGGKP
jgi:hypothetical protein